MVVLCLATFFAINNRLLCRFSTGNVRVPQEAILIDKNLTSPEWFYLPPLICLKYEVLGINAHLRSSIKKESVDLNQLWNGNFLKPNQSKEVSNVAQVTFYFRVVRRIERLHPKFLDSKLNEYQLQSGGLATHLVEQVVYGAEFICSMWRTINCQHETKENVEGIIYSEVEHYFNQIFGQNSTSPDSLASLDAVKCQILSSLDARNELEGSFRESIQYLMDAMSFDKDDSHWKPIEITLRNIPEQMEARLWLEREADFKFRRDNLEVTFNWIFNESETLNGAHLEMFPQFQSVMCQFHFLLGPLGEKIKRLDATITPQRVFVVNQFSNLLLGMTEWLIQRRSEIEKILRLIKDTQLTVLDLAVIENRTAPNKRNRAKVFVLRAELKPDPLVQFICKFIDHPLGLIASLPVLPILLADKERLQKIRRELDKFSKEAQLNSSLDQDERNSYHIGITSEYPNLTDGMITTIEDYKKENDSQQGNSHKVQFPNLCSNCMIFCSGIGIKQESRSLLGSEMNPSTGVFRSMEKRYDTYNHA